MRTIPTCPIALTASILLGAVHAALAQAPGPGRPGLPGGPGFAAPSGQPGVPTQQIISTIPAQPALSNIPAQPATANLTGPMRVTSDTAEYCEQLSQRVTHAQLAPSGTTALPRGRRAEVEQLANEGHTMCIGGRIRSGLLRLRRAWMLLRDAN